MRFAFWTKLVLASIPMVVPIVVPIGVAIYMGEAMPVPMVVATQVTLEPTIYGPSDNETIYSYKFQSTLAREPQVLVLGSSRVLQFRSEFLKNPDNFYNASGEGWGLREISAFMRDLPAEQSPEILILGLDQVWFNAQLDNWEDEHSLDTTAVDLNRVIGATRHLMDDLVSSDIQLGAVLDRREWVRQSIGLGLNALQFGRGYRNDGSHQNGDLLFRPELGDLAREHDLAMVSKGWRQFGFGSEVSKSALVQLSHFLDDARSKGITVIGIFPPFMPSIFEKMLQSGQHQYLVESEQAVEEIFAAYGQPFFDFSDPRIIGGSDDELYDGWHSTELLSLRMFVAMAEALPQSLGQWTDTERLRSDILSATNPLEVYPP